MRLSTHQLSNLTHIEKESLYTVAQLAPLLKTSARTLRYYCAKGIFEHATKIGQKTWIIPGGDIISLLPHLRSRPVENPTLDRPTLDRPSLDSPSPVFGEAARPTGSEG